jgi:hypothetical protein
MDGSSNYLGQSELLAHFGLGATESIDQIVVQWPSGYEQAFTDVAVNQRVTITEGLLADVNGDDVVDALDLDVWGQHFGMASGALSEQGDVNRNGAVDGADLLAIQRSLGRSVVSGLAASSFPAVAVPEPLAWVLLAAAAPLLRRRSSQRKSDNFLFQLSAEELEDWRSHFVTSNPAAKMGLRRRPYVFTEQGVAMLSSVLRSPRAVAVNIEIMRAFVRLRQMLASHADLARRLDELENKYDHNFRVVFDAIRQLMTPSEAPKKPPIGFHSQPPRRS